MRRPSTEGTPQNEAPPFISRWVRVVNVQRLIAPAAGTPCVAAGAPWHKPRCKSKKAPDEPSGALVESLPSTQKARDLQTKRRPVSGMVCARGTAGRRVVNRARLS